MAPGRQRAPPGPLLTSSLSRSVCLLSGEHSRSPGLRGQAAPPPPHSSRPEGPSPLAARGLALCAGQRWIHPAGLLWALGLNHVDGWQAPASQSPGTVAGSRGSVSTENQEHPGRHPEPAAPAGSRLDSTAHRLPPTAEACFILTEARLCSLTSGSFRSFLKGGPPCSEAAVAPQVPGGLCAACTPGFSSSSSGSPRGGHCARPLPPADLVSQLLSRPLLVIYPQWVVGAWWRSGRGR